MLEDLGNRGTNWKNKNNKTLLVGFQMFIILVKNK